MEIKKKVAIIFSSLVLISIICIKIMPLYYYYFSLQNYTQAAIKLTPFETDSSIKKRIYSHAEKIGIPITIEDIKIDRKEHSTTINILYKEAVSFNWGKTKYTVFKLPFSVNVSA